MCWTLCQVPYLRCCIQPYSSSRSVHHYHLHFTHGKRPGGSSNLTKLISVKLYFTDYAVIVVPVSLSLSPSTQHPTTLRQSPHHCSCPWVMCISSLAPPFPILYCIPPWLFCNYLFVLLNPLTSSPISLYPLLSGNHQNVLCIHDSVSVVCLVCLFKIQLLIDLYFLPLYYSVLIFFFLK